MPKNSARLVGDVDDWSEELAREYGLPDGWLAKMYKSKSVAFRHGRDGKALKSFAEVEKVVGFLPHKTFAKKATDEWSADLASEFGLPDGWLAKRYANTQIGFKDGKDGEVFKSLAAVSEEIGFFPQKRQHQEGPPPAVKEARSNKFCADDWSADVACAFGLPEGWLARKGPKTYQFRNGMAGKNCKSIPELEEELGYLPEPLQCKKKATVEWSADLASEFGLPDGWLAKRYSNNQIGFKDGKDGEVFTGLAAVKEELEKRRQLQDAGWSADLASMFGLPEGWLARKGPKSYQFRNGMAGKNCKSIPELEEELGYLPEPLQCKKKAADEWSADLASEFGLPDGWLAKRYSNNQNGFKNGKGGRIFKSLAAVKEEIEFFPQKRQHQEGPPPAVKEARSNKFCADDWSADLACAFGLPEGWLARKSRYQFRQGIAGKSFKSILELKDELGYLPEPLQQKLQARKRLKSSPCILPSEDADAENSSGSMSVSSPVSQTAPAGASAEPEKRYDGRDGPFTYEEFEEFYGKKKASSKWENAMPGRPAQKRGKKRDTDIVLERSDKDANTDIGKASKTGKKMRKEASEKNASVSSAPSSGESSLSSSSMLSSSSSDDSGEPSAKNLTRVGGTLILRRPKAKASSVVFEPGGIPGKQGNKEVSKTAASGGGRALKVPPGWVQEYSDEYQLPFYFNEKTEESIWEAPPEWYC